MIIGEKERERQTKKQTLNYREQSDGYQRRSGWGRWVRWVMGVKEALVRSTVVWKCRITVLRT